MRNWTHSRRLRAAEYAYDRASASWERGGWKPNPQWERWIRYALRLDPFKDWNPMRVYPSGRRIPGPSTW